MGSTINFFQCDEREFDRLINEGRINPYKADTYISNNDLIFVKDISREGHLQRGLSTVDQRISEIERCLKGEVSTFASEVERLKDSFEKFKEGIEESHLKSENGIYDLIERIGELNLNRAKKKEKLIGIDLSSTQSFTMENVTFDREALEEISGIKLYPYSEDRDWEWWNKDGRVE